MSEPSVSVLVVDDPSEGLAEHLAGEGFKVRTADDGPAALADVSSDPPDAVITSLPVPGMGGWEFLRGLQAASPRPPFTVTVSESGREKDRAQGTDAAHLHLVKPVDPKVLATVLRHLRRPWGR